MNLDLNPDDIEYSLMKQIIFKKIKFGEVPSLIELTNLAQQCALAELEKLIDMVLVKDEHHKVDYAIYSGVQIHTTKEDFICPNENGCYVVVDGKKSKLEFPPIVNIFKQMLEEKQKQKQANATPSKDAK